MRGRFSRWGILARCVIGHPALPLYINTLRKAPSGAIFRSVKRNQKKKCFAKQYCWPELRIIGSREIGSFNIAGNRRHIDKVEATHFWGLVLWRELSATTSVPTVSAIQTANVSDCFHFDSDIYQHKQLETDISTASLPTWRPPMMAPCTWALTFPHNSSKVSFHDALHATHHLGC